MRAHAEVFISATTRELRSYRGETKNALLTLKIFPIEQSNFELAHGPLSATNRLAEAEPLSRKHLRIFAEFGHRTGHEHPHFHAAINNYAGLLSAMGLRENAIAVRVRSAIEGEPEESA
jgi:hypothetical protein